MAKQQPQLIRQATFELIAEVLRREHERAQDGSGNSLTVQRIAIALADEFQKTNPRFKRSLFLLQVGV